MNSEKRDGFETLWNNNVQTAPGYVSFFTVWSYVKKKYKLNMPF